jgi:hypothetical protein
MSFLRSLAASLSQSVTGYQERASDRWARQVVSTLPDNVQFIFNQVAENKLVSGFSDEVSFYEKPQTSDVAVLKTKHEISILFYVGGISEQTIEIIDWQFPFDGIQTSLLKIKDVVSPILIKGPCCWEVGEITLESDFAKCIKSIEGQYLSFSDTALSSSEILFKEIIRNMDPNFRVISKADFDKRDYMTAHIKVVDFPMENNDRLAVLGNGIGMNDWKQLIPMRLVRGVQQTWHLTIRGNSAAEFTLALLGPDNTFKLESREPRKFKNIRNPEDEELYPFAFQ